MPNCLRSCAYFAACSRRRGARPSHLRADADAAFVQRLDGDLVALADFAEHVRFRHAAVFENQLAGGRRADAELVFLLADGEAGEVALDEERGDAVVAGLGIDGGEDDEESGFVAVGDPQLAAVEDVVAAFGVGAGRQRERVAAGAGFGERVGADGVGCHARQVALLLLVVAPAQQRVDDERVLHVDEDADGGVDARQLFDGEDRVEERAAGAAVLLGNLDAHQAELEELVKQVFVEDALFVHLLDQRPDFLVGKLADVVAKHDFVFGEGGQRRRRREL